MNQDQNDQNWLDDLRKSGDSEAQRVGVALRKQFDAKMRQSPTSIDELKRLELRLERESLLKKDLSPPRALTEWLLERFSSYWQWAVPVTAIALATLWIVNPIQKNMGENGNDDLRAYRGLDLANPTRIFTDLSLAGHQYQIVSNPEQAESEWKSALIEAGVTFESYRSKSLPGAIEIHVRLSVEIDLLEPTFALPKAPHQGEWIVYLIPEQS